MKVFVPFSLEEKGTKENIRNRQRTSREGLAPKERGFIEDEVWRIFGCIRMSMKPQSLDGIATAQAGRFLPRIGSALIRRTMRPPVVPVRGGRLRSGVMAHAMTQNLISGHTTPVPRVS